MLDYTDCKIASRAKEAISKAKERCFVKYAFVKIDYKISTRASNMRPFSAGEYGLY